MVCEEYVLLKAWKKTAAYIRYHNWVSDTLALDRAAVNLPAFLREYAHWKKTGRDCESRPNAPPTWGRFDMKNTAQPSNKIKQNSRLG